MFISHLILYFFSNDNNILIVCYSSVLNGIVCGWCLILMIIIISTGAYWGTIYVSGNYAISDGAFGVGSFIFAIQIVGKIYQKYDDNTCLESRCWKNGFAIMNLWYANFV